MYLPWNHHLDEDTEGFHTPGSYPCALSPTSNDLAFPQKYSNMHHHRIYFFLPVLGLNRTKNNLVCIHFCLLLFSITSVRFTHIDMYSSSSLFFCVVQYSIMWIYHNLSILLLMALWVVSSLLHIMLLAILKYVFFVWISALISLE